MTDDIDFGVYLNYNDIISEELVMKQRVAIYFICFVVLTYTVPSVAISGIVSYFPQVGESAVLLVTLPNLTGIIGILFTSYLTRYFPLKKLSVISLGLLLISGLGSLLLKEHYSMLIVGSGLMGIAYGMLSTLFPLLINRYYSGELRNKVMGQATGMLQSGRIIAIVVGGVLADIHWYDVYYVFIIVFIPLLLTIRYLPQDIPSSNETKKAQLHQNQWKALIRISLIGFSFAVLYFISSTHVSLYIEGYGIGSAMTTGWVSGLSSVFAILVAVLFAKIYRKSQNYTFFLIFLILGLGYLPMGLSIQLPFAILGICSAAIAMALFSPYLMIAIADACDSTTLAATTAFVLAFVNIGYFASPYITEFMASLLQLEGTASVFLIAAVFGLLLAACLLMRNLRKR